MLKQAMASILTPEETEQMYGAFDQIGNRIILRIPDSLLPRRKEIGEVLLEKVGTARSIFYQSSPVEGDYRIRRLELLAGEDSTETEYREHGCRFKVDIEKAFFSPRLSTERLRIADLVNDGDVVVNMFGGVGMFSIVAAKKKKCHVYSIDINPYAVDLCSQNVALNKLQGTVESIEGDASEVIEKRLAEVGDRVLMLLPERSDEFLPSAVKSLKRHGILHYYCHVHSERKGDAPSVAREHFLSVMEGRAEVLGAKNVRPIGPRFYQAVVDARLS
ncbi:MAG: class I SAM-dependent methyltransferase family protein [Thaumarchaeota archaeon]|nr:class I SAM-dependent methyltransferase family protein [Nitrososphaerota archaeon]